MGAVAALFLGLLEAGDHIVAGDQLYGRSLRLLTRDLPRLGFEATFADPTDAAAFARAIRPRTRMVLVEVRPGSTTSRARPSLGARVAPAARAAVNPVLPLLCKSN